jgi:hypothetical protein
MYSASFKMIYEAIRDKAVIECTYLGYTRHCCPHALGHADGVERVLMYQFGGGSSTGLPAGGEWRCMDVSDMSKITLRKGERWRTGLSQARPQGCIDHVLIQVYA